MSTCLRFFKDSLKFPSVRWSISWDVSLHGLSGGGGGGGSFGLQQKNKNINEKKRNTLLDYSKAEIW